MGLLSQLMEKLHVLLALLAIWLLSTSGQVHLASRIHPNAGAWDYNHIILGAITALMSLLFLVKCCRHGQWRLYFGWCTGQLAPIIKDLKKLGSRQLPAAGSPGLLTFIEGIGLLLMAAIGLTGLAWLATQGTGMAMTWRSWHILLSEGLIWYLILHAVASFSHFLELIR
ncbi:cytochrome b/b6 domain-containing protein [Ferrimonas sediminicola]|uniref:Cytochrome b/b6 domain-containing protein n=1 Tax=Ferrimonas sediminicola TaxID=2569538 RepID=A0A4U1BGK3_9GAMM|nr:cytochrome b/b6 domain-containing protein [Ferrimonas sediminicola]TKB50321.1 cytochrome b/b6 domain-containing protein [Ferrimonas sediminicola]